MTETDLERARRAADDHDWNEAFGSYERVAAVDGLTGADLERFAEAGWWTAHPNESLRAAEDAFAAYVAEGNERHAAVVALQIAWTYQDRLQQGPSNGWRRRAARLLEGLPEGAEHGYLELSRITFGEVGSPEEALEVSARVLDIGTRFGDADLQAFGLLTQGKTLISEAKVEEGLALVDEATVAAVNGDLTPITTGTIYCITIDLCRDLADYARAGDWTEAASRWCERQSVPGFPGICRVHRAEIMRLRGSFVDAEAEARRSTEELTTFGMLSFAGAGYHEIGEIRLRMGDLDAAEEAFAQAHQLGHEPQPGLALLHLAHQRIDAARSSISTALADEGEPLARARLLPARVEVAVAAHDLADARAAAEELEAIASRYEAPAIHAGSHHALGVVLAGEGEDLPRAIAELRRAVKLWTDADLPFEAAWSRRWLAIASHGSGDVTAAALELRAARTAFLQLGARLEAARCDELEAAWSAGGDGRRVTRTFVFTDIVGSTNLLESMGDEAWEDLSRWHDETLRGLIDQHRGEVVHPTGDGFFATFADAGSAASCAVAIQRRLADHRRRHGFAPQVRIGMHAAEATAVGDDYAGIGVHEAARVGALAEGGEILVTLETLDREPIAFPVTDERTVELKGIAQPVRVARVEWKAT